MPFTLQKSPAVVFSILEGKQFDCAGAGMNELVEHVFPTGDRRIPLDHTPLNQLPTWGHWLETPHLTAAMLTPGQLEVNLLAPFEFISTRFQPGHGIAAFDYPARVGIEDTQY